MCALRKMLLQLGKNVPEVKSQIFSPDSFKGRFRRRDELAFDCLVPVEAEQNNDRREEFDGR